MPYFDYPTILKEIKSAGSRDEMINGLKRLGMIELSKNKTALDILFDLTHNPLSKMRQEINNDILFHHLKHAAEQFNLRLDAIIEYNFKLAALERELLKADEASNKPRRVEINDEHVIKDKNKEEPTLAEKLREQEAKINNLMGEIRDIDEKIQEKQKELVNVLSEEQGKQVESVEKIHLEFIKELLKPEIDAINKDSSLNEAEKAKLIDNLIEAESANISHSANDSAMERLLKDYNNIVADYRYRLEDTKEKIRKLSSPEGSRLSNGEVLEKIASLITLTDMAMAQQCSALEKRAKAIASMAAEYDKLQEKLENKKEDEDKFNKYNAYAQETIELQQKIDALTKEIDQFTAEYPNEKPTDEILAKIKERETLIQQHTEKAAFMDKHRETWQKVHDEKIKLDDYKKYEQNDKDINRLLDEVNALNTRIDKYRKDHPDKEPTELLKQKEEKEKKLYEIDAEQDKLRANWKEVDKEIKDQKRILQFFADENPKAAVEKANKMVANLKKQKEAGLKTLKEHGKEHSQRTRSLLNNPVVEGIMNSISNLFNSKKEKAGQLEQATEIRAEMNLHIANGQTVDNRQTQAPSHSAAATSSKTDDEQNRQTSPSMVPRPSGSAAP